MELSEKIVPWATQVSESGGTTWSDVETRVGCRAFNHPSWDLQHGQAHSQPILIPKNLTRIASEEQWCSCLRLNWTPQLGVGAWKDEFTHGGRKV